MRKKIKMIVVLIIMMVFVFSCSKNTDGEIGNDLYVKKGEDNTSNMNKIQTKEVNNVNKIGIIGRNFELYKNLYEENKNLLFSNAGIESVFEMARLASNDNTKKQIELVFGINNNDLNSEAVNTYNFMVSNETSGGVLTKKSYIDILQKLPYIKADIYSIKKEEDADTFEKIINDRIEKETNGQIKNVVKASMYKDKLFKAQLANVIHFLGKWANATDEGYVTRNMYFKNNNGETVVRKFFNTKTNDANLFENDDVIAFSLDYKEDNGRYKYVAMIPKNEKSDLKSIDVSKLNAYAGEYIIDTTLPCFEIESENELVEPIKKLGITDIFDPQKANLTNAFDIKNENVYVNRVYQKAKIKVDEFGTEASAYTSMMMTFAMAPVEKAKKKVRYIHITLDRPFIYMIYDTKIDEPLFIGDVKFLENEKYDVDKEYSHQITIVDEIIEVDEDAKTK